MALVAGEGAPRGEGRRGRGRREGREGWRQQGAVQNLQGGEGGSKQPGMYQNVLARITKLRQACDHPFLARSRGDTKTSLAAVERHLAGEGGASAPSALVAEVMERLRRRKANEAAEAAAPGHDADAAAAAEEREEECPVCLDPPQDTVITHCAHFFCRECIHGHFGAHHTALCPLCRTDAQTVLRVYH